jgi:hypothetical protein
MKQTFVLVAALGLMTAAAAAESSASSASSAGSASSASVSDSIQGSSNSSTGGGKVAAGEYRVVAITAADAARQRVELVSEGGARFALLLPNAAAELRVGETVAVLERPYGYAFARGAAGGDTFFVALADGWVQDQSLKAITL